MSSRSSSGKMMMGGLTAVIVLGGLAAGGIILELMLNTYISSQCHSFACEGDPGQHYTPSVGPADILAAIAMVLVPLAVLALLAFMGGVLAGMFSPKGRR